MLKTPVAISRTFFHSTSLLPSGRVSASPMKRPRRSGLLAQQILALPVTMIQPPFVTALMPPIGASTLMTASKQLAALRAAIAMSAITVGADVEDRVALLPAARSLQETRIVMEQHRRHRRLGGVAISLRAGRRMRGRG